MCVCGGVAHYTTNTHTPTRRCTNTPERATELGVKSPELPQKRHAADKQTHTHTHIRARPELSSLTVSPRCITLSGMQGGGSPRQAWRIAQPQERRRCCVFATGDGGGGGIPGSLVGRWDRLPSPAARAAKRSLRGSSERRGALG